MTKSEYQKCIEEAVCSQYSAMLPDVKEEHIFSDKFEKSMERLIKKRKKPYYYYVNTAFKRVAVILVVLVTASVTTILSVKAFRDFFKDFFIYICYDHSHIVADDLPDDEKTSVPEEYPKTILSKYDVTANMAGYERTVEYEDDSLIMISYVNDDITVDFEQNTIESYDEFINTENASIDKIDINGHEAIGFLDNHDHYSVIWNNGEYIIVLRSNIDKNELISIAKTVKKIE